MTQITFITGNQHKADYLAKYLGFSVEHRKLDLDELQSLDIREIAEHKAKQAYGMLRAPVLVEDVSLEFEALGRLPGTFIKFFQQELSFEAICSLVDGKSRNATARCVVGYYDGKRLELLEGKLDGKVADRPSGDKGFGWDKIFIPDGYTVTRASLNEDDYRTVYLQIRPLAKLKKLLEGMLAED